ncbi:ABC transporter ATP-binding protein [Leptolyngbya sp. PCC 6406]|uniref:ABC transporter ATP-binding protein n=1 Tax=Leptolyngbya sp. PCC 6406 TaxID=1173264 RepID=UPI0002AC8014|nr:ABC transporter ATP-binding protein [Leptolyngbya sp. PCC 6406]
MAQVVIENLYKTFPQGVHTAPPGTEVVDSLDLITDPTAGGSAVLRRINLAVEDGEFMVLVGPSGCGKSTLLRLLSGLETATAGNIWVGDRQVTHLPPKQRDTAMVFQSYALYPHLTVYDNLAFGLRRMQPRPLVVAQPTQDSAESVAGTAATSAISINAKSNPETHTHTDANAILQQALLERVWWQQILVTLSRRLPPGLRYVSKAEKLIDSRVRSVARMLQIEPLLGRYPRQLSGGQKQRVALGRAMARNPQVFLMDEPLSNLDAKLRTETRANIVNLQRQLGITTLYVTHDQVEAMTMGDRIAVINQGQIQQVATPLTLYREPANRFVASFIGSPPMNFLSVQVKPPLVVSHPGFRITLPGLWETVLSSYDGQRVILGIRPEHLTISLPAPKNLPVTVTRIEALGSETYLTVTLGHESLQVRVAPDITVALGEELWLAIAPEHIHLFHSDTGATLRPTSP